MFPWNLYFFHHPFWIEQARPCLERKFKRSFQDSLNLLLSRGYHINMNQLRIFYSTIFRLKMKNESSWLNDAVMMLQWWILTICRYFKFSSLRNHLSTMQAQQTLWMQQSFSRVFEELLLWCANVELIYINLMLLRFFVQTIFTKDITFHPIPLVSTTHHYVLICAL